MSFLGKAEELAKKANRYAKELDEKRLEKAKKEQKLYAEKAKAEEAKTRYEKAREERRKIYADKLKGFSFFGGEQGEEESERLRF